MEFIVHSEEDSLPAKQVSPEMVIFYITQDTQRHTLLPEMKSGGFRVTGKICTQCSLSDSIGGELTVEASTIPIQSIDIHLLRVESILIGEKIATESSLIQTTQAISLFLDSRWRCLSWHGSAHLHDSSPPSDLSNPFCRVYGNYSHILEVLGFCVRPFSIEFKVSIVITFQSDLSKKHPKADPKAPKPWLALESVPLELVRTT
ncbi:hypothetical protein BUALT_Bualt02G0084000 [Buddleja alternifolia]|uniref:Uncharacterized protein n=1 Tax=Buddleja alternifolia TaxID=168488 RepID=A0AAV6Y6I4_9LAMI|nr:hypothetical protein BUALT_Bualt02G0084000 [Buddleja alternifolia]